MLNLVKITKKIFDHGNEIEILHNLNLKIECNQIVSLIGESGSGKSTLLHIAGLISSIDGGEIYINDINCTNMNDDQKSEMRKKIGFIYQFHHLMPEFTAFENLLLPQIISGITQQNAEQNATNLLSKFNLLYLKDRKPQYMSGGENQRIAILRAFIKNPVIVLADEPTGNLDEKNANEIFDFILENSREKKISCLVISHNNDLAKKTDKIVHMSEINKADK